MSLLPLHLPVLLLVAASVTCAYRDCKPPDKEAAYDRFLRQHHDESSGGKDYCDKRMHLKCMTNQDPPKTRCKEKNSFIHAFKKQIQAVCDKAGSPYEKKPNMIVSNLPFRVTTCKNQGDPSVHPCEYRGSTTTRRIVIACENKLPTHFDEGIVVPQ